MGIWYLIAVAVVVALLCAGLLALGRAQHFRWLRWSMALGLLLIAVLAATTSPWPDGLGLRECTEVLNPALAEDSKAVPWTIETCAPMAVTGAAVIFFIGLVLFALAPDVSEFGFPGLLSLKKRVTEQEERSERLTTEVAQVAASAAARTTVHNKIVVAVDGVARGQQTDFAPVVAEVVNLSVHAVLSDSARLLPLEGAQLVFYRHIGAGLLREWDKTAAMVTDFRSGFGATGQAWRDEKTIVVTGERVHNGDYGLTLEQQEYFRDVTIVAATPIWDLEGRLTVGVVMATSSASYDPSQEDDIKDAFGEGVEKAARLLSAMLAAYDISY